MDARSTPVLVVFTGLSALAIGSFTNVVIDRMPRPLPVPNEFGELWDTRPWSEVAGGHSRCSSCAQAIRPVDNVPVLSFLALRGRCRTCRAAIPRFHPLVEILVPVVVLTIAAADGWTWRLPALAVAVPFLTAIAIIDQRTMMVPTRLVWPGFVAVAAFTVVGAALANNWDWLRSAVAGSVLLAAPLALIWFVVPRAMGFGDVRLAVLVGWWSSLAVHVQGLLERVTVAVAVLASASAIGVVMGLAVAGARRRTDPVPFGPALVLAGLVCVLAASSLRSALVP